MIVLVAMLVFYLKLLGIVIKNYNNSLLTSFLFHIITILRKLLCVDVFQNICQFTFLTKVKHSIMN